ncbi:uncharacterized protein V6R79_024548 [Siganus canaliculatus]
MDQRVEAPLIKPLPDHSPPRKQTAQFLCSCGGSHFTAGTEVGGTAWWRMQSVSFGPGSSKYEPDAQEGEEKSQKVVERVDPDFFSTTTADSERTAPLISRLFLPAGN